MTQLKKSVNEYIIGSEQEVEIFINEQKAISDSELIGYNVTQKDVKQKGEIMDTYYIVKITRKYEV